MTSIAACLIVSSCAKWLPYTIEGCAPYVDEVIIVEGATPEWIRLGNAKQDGSSVDNTRAVIYEMKKRFGSKIKYIPPKVYRHRNEQRQVYLDVAESDWIWLIDHDEFYHPEGFDNVRNAIAAKPSHLCIATKWYAFYTWTRRKPGLAAEMERIFRHEHGMYYPDRNSGQAVMRAGGEPVWKHAWQEKNTYCYHYNRVEDPIELAAKLMYYVERDMKRKWSLRQFARYSVEQYSIRKPRESGAFVPLSEQPPAARKLINTSIAPLTSQLSRMDIRLGGK